MQAQSIVTVGELTILSCEGCPAFSWNGESASRGDAGYLCDFGAFSDCREVSEKAPLAIPDNCPLRICPHDKAQSIATLENNEEMTMGPEPEKCEVTQSDMRQTSPHAEGAAPNVPALTLVALKSRPCSFAELQATLIAHIEHVNAEGARIQEAINSKEPKVWRATV